MKLVMLSLDDSVSQFKLCEDKDTEECVKEFALITKLMYDGTRNSAKIEVFEISLVDTVKFEAEKFKRNKEVLTRFKHEQ